MGKIRHRLAKKELINVSKGKVDSMNELIIVPLGPELLALTREEYERSRDRAVAEGFAKREAPEIPQGTDNRQFLTVKELAFKYNVSEPLIYSYVREGKIPFIKIGQCVRFNKSEIASHFHPKNNQIPSKLSIKAIKK